MRWIDAEVQVFDRLANDINAKAANDYVLWFDERGIGNRKPLPEGPSSSRFCPQSRRRFRSLMATADSIVGCFIAAELRDELLNGEIFYSLKESQIVIEQWRRH